ncbi:hypothetical protein FSP39_014081 [Pinctada imbricata]|uniref:Uncharacterized protein n=1 Tax=Pinctada imbricata TaxID=66713 RepID=A0AA88YIJ4_PINIB|nr:hypothetical protein FSP39_014081 [Pinctada imbricata]
MAEVQRSHVQRSSIASGRTRVGGYDADFIPSLDRKYVCPICLAALREPMQTLCGHRFCRNCIMGCVQEGMRTARCPVDNVVLIVHKELFEDNAFRREVLSLTVKCDNSTQGCTWTGELRELEGHKLSCSYVMVECEHRCGVQVLQRLMTEHLVSCERRPTVCTHCQMTIPFADMTKHQLLMCQNLPVQCTSCGKGGIQRKDIAKHIDVTTGDCPSTVIPCQYAQFGCQFQSLRRLMPDHLNENTNQHILLLVRRISDQEQRIQTLESTMSTDHSEMTVPVSKFIFGQYFTGSLDWKIPLPSENLLNLKSTFVSPSFYTGCPGYQLHVTLGLNAHVQENEKWTSVHLTFEKGIFDDELPPNMENSTWRIKIVSQLDVDDRLRDGISDCISCTMVRPTYRFPSYRVGKENFMLSRELLEYEFTKNGYLHVNVWLER